MKMAALIYCLLLLLLPVHAYSYLTQKVNFGLIANVINTDENSTVSDHGWRIQSYWDEEEFSYVVYIYNIYDKDFRLQLKGLTFYNNLHDAIFTKVN